jgi:putative ABC transport system permease protein
MPRWTARNSRDRDLDDEIVHDLELEIDELVRAGMSREKAERASRRDFGNVLYIKEDIRGRWTRTWLERLAQDLRYAARTLRRDFAFSLTALLSLVLGIGVATALFSVGYAILIAPFPYAKPGEIWNVSQGAAFHVSDYLEIGQLPACSEVMAESPVDVLRTGSGVFETLRVMQLSGNSFSFLGAQPLLGRTIRPTDIHADGTAEPVAVLSYEAWQRWFGGDAGAIGKTLLLNRQPRTVVGVMAPRFGWWTDVWLPLPLDRYDRPVTLKLRLRAGVPRGAAEGQLRALLTRNATLGKVHWDRAGRGLETAMKWLMLVGGLLLLISCASVANLQLARVTVRSREIAVRAALGAGPLRLVRQLLTESVALSLAGGALGVLLALPLMSVIAALLPDLRSVRPDEVRISLSGTVVLFSVGISLAAGILSGLAPALQCARLSLPEALKDAAGASGGRQAGDNLLAGLVVVEVALAVILLFGAIVTAREYATVRERGRGFQTVRVLKSGFSLPPKLYPGYAGRTEFARSLLERLQKLPGVESAALGSPAGLQSGASIAGRPEAAPRLVSVAVVSRGFGSTLGIPLRAGRDLEQQEIDRAVPVALVNERAARLLWPTGANPISARGSAWEFSPIRTFCFRWPRERRPR